MLRHERDGRLISPFQHERPFVVKTNAEAGVNRITEQNQVLQPNARVYLLIYYVVTTNTRKLNLVVSGSTSQKASSADIGTRALLGCSATMRSSRSTGLP